MASGSKKISKAERLRLLREEEERRLLEEEQARLRAEQEQAVKAEKERVEREKTERLEAKDHERRGEELAELYELEESFLLATKWKLQSRALAKWEHYTCCDGSPDPTVPQEINTFMSLWLEESQNDLTTVVEKGSKVLELIAKLEMYVLETPFDEVPSDDITQYQETMVHLQRLLRHKYNQATEHLLKQASSYAESESGNMEVVMKEKDITLCLWANLKKNPRFRNQLFHDENNQPCHGFELPKPLTTCDVAVRILHTTYDHLSPFQAFPNEPPKLDLPSAEEVIQPVEEKQAPSEEQESLRDYSVIKTEASGRTMTFSDVFSYSERRRSSSSRGSGSREDHYNKSSFFLRSTSRAHVSALRLFAISELDVLEDHTVDLHQFMPVGGIYHCDLLKLPPQAKLVKGWTIVEVMLVLKREELRKALACHVAFLSPISFFVLAKKRRESELGVHTILHQGNKDLVASFAQYRPVLSQLRLSVI